MEQGIHKISAEQYHSSPGVSNSLLRRMLPTPSHFKHSQPKRGNALDVGAALHSLLLDGEERFYTRPDTYESEDGPKKWNSNSNVCKAWLDEHRDKPVITSDEVDAIRQMRYSVSTHKFAGQALKDAATEQSIFATCPSTGLLLRARLDAIPAAGRISGIKPILDVKTCQRADKFSFSKTIHERGYEQQAAFYIDIANLVGLNVDSFILIAVEKEPPYAVAVYDLEPSAISQGRRDYTRLLNTYAHCLKHDHWPGYNEGPELIDIPDYAYDPELE